MAASLENLTIQDARDAMRRYGAKRGELVYRETMKEVADKLEYSSSSHLVATVFGLVLDSMNTLWEPGKAALNSPLAKGFIREKIGDRDVLEYLKEAQVSGKSGAEREKAKAEFDRTLDGLRLMEEYPKNLVEYCKEKKKTPDKVLNSPRDRLEIIEKSYGSLARYEAIEDASIVNVAPLIKQIDAFEQAPISMIVPLMIMGQSPEVAGYLMAARINPNEIGKIAESYSRDLVKFGKAYIEKYLEQSKNERAQYRKIKASQ